MIKKILYILDYKHKKYCLILLLLFIPVTFLETIGIGSLPAFVLFITQPDSLNSYISNLEIKTLISNLTLYERAFYGSILIGLIFLIKAIVILFVSYFEVYLVKIINVTNASKLYKIYLDKDYYFHIENDPPKLIQNMSDVSRATGIIFSFLTLIKESFLIIVVITLLFFSDPKTFSIVFLILSIPLVIYNLIFKKSLKDRGSIARKFRIMSLKDITQGLAGIKFTKLLNKENFLMQAYKKNLNKAAHQDMFLMFLSKTPRIFLEILSISMILIMILAFVNDGKNFNEFLPLLTFIVVATVRLIPSFGNITSSLNNFKFNSISLNNVYSSLSENNSHKKNTFNDEVKSFEKNSKEILKVESLDFNYPDKKENVFKNLSLNINKNTIVGITGTSGSGKTTLVDILLGLLNPSNGNIMSYGNNINTFLKAWRKSIGYVPQDVNLVDDSIKKNICYGYKDEEINKELLEKCIEFAELGPFISSLSHSLETNIGHLGKKLSGGQLQRIGIARALYQNPNLLIFDEATNALDIETESKLIRNLKKFKDDLTIILISHRLSVLKNCDQIFLINKGKIIYEGSFKDMPKINEEK